MEKIMRTLKDGLAAGWKFFKKDKKRRWLFLSALILLGLITYLSVAFFTISPEEVALAELRQTFVPGIICHEKCALFREARERLIATAWRRQQAKTSKLFFKSWQETDSNPAFRQELVKLFYLADSDNPPPYLKAYLIADEADLGVIREIIFRFPLITSGYSEFKNKLASRMAQAPSLAERIEFLKILREISNDSEIDSYFSVLIGEEELDFKRETIKNISNIKDKSAYFTLEHLDIIEALILKDETEPALRRDLALLIGDYYLVFPKEAALLWKKVYAEKDLDTITRLFSADNLNHLESSNLDLPEVSPAEWAEYYN